LIVIEKEDTIDIIELQKVLFLCMDEGVWGVEVQFHMFLNLVQDRWILIFALWLLFPWERGLSTHWMGSWLALTDGLESWKSDHDLCVIQPAASSLNQLSYPSSIIE